MGTATKTESKFKLGKTVTTGGIANEIDDIEEFGVFVYQSLQRHRSGDWGDLDGEDKHTNEVALLKGKEGRILSRYNYEPDRSLDIYIITEWDRSVTTILFPSEY